MTLPPLPSDPQLPHLQFALDSASMQRHFARPGTLAPGWTVQHCAIERVKFRPRRNLAVAYRLTLRHARRGVVTEQFVAARWCSGGESAQRFAKASAGSAVASPAGPAVTHDPALDLVAHWWPNDARLGSAAAAFGHARRMHGQWLPEIARQLAAASATLTGAQLEIVQLVPEHRVTARARLQLADGSEHTVYAKGDAEQRGPATQAAMQALWDGDARRRGTLVVPQPLGWQPASGLHWQRAVAGRALLDTRLADPARTAVQVGAMLAALHDTPVQLTRTESPTPKRERIIELQTTLGLVDAMWTPAVARLTRALEPMLPTLFGGPAATLHGDLHPRNVMVRPDGGPAFIDLDGLRRGPALLDLGAWAADGLYRAQLAGAPAEACVALLREFMRGYRRAGGAAPTEAEWAAATAWQLLNQRVWRCAINLKPGRFALVRPLLETAQVLLATGSLNAATHARRMAA